MDGPLLEHILKKMIDSNLKTGQKLDAVKMFLLAISEASVRL